MKLELKAIKFSQWASEETNCFQAKLYVDGKPFAVISNDGHGGCDRVDPVNWEKTDRAEFNAKIKEIDAFLATTDEGVEYHAKYSDDDFQMHFDLEAWCGRRIDDHLFAKDMKSALRKKALFLNPDGKLYQMGYRGNRKPDDALYEMVVEKNPGAKILNIMDTDKALEIYRGATA